MDLPAAIRAAAGHGRPGTVAVTEHSCYRLNCHTRGNFTSDDGTITRVNVDYDGHPPRGTHPGTRVAAIDVGGSAVYGYPRSYHWLMNLGGFLLAAMFGWPSIHRSAAALVYQHATCDRDREIALGIDARFKKTRDRASEWPTEASPECRLCD